MKPYHRIAILKNNKYPKELSAQISQMTFKSCTCSYQHTIKASCKEEFELTTKF